MVFQVFSGVPELGLYNNKAALGTPERLSWTHLEAWLAGRPTRRILVRCPSQLGRGGATRARALPPPTPHTHTHRQTLNSRHYKWPDETLGSTRPGLLQTGASFLLTFENV